MTKPEQLVAALKLAHPGRTEDEILAELLEQGMIHHGYVIEESVESNKEKPQPVKKWVVLKDGKPEFRGDTEQEAIEYRDRCIGNDYVDEGGEG
jgi:hypothetical protein